MPAELELAIVADSDALIGIGGDKVIRPIFGRNFLLEFENFYSIYVDVNF